MNIGHEAHAGAHGHMVRFMHVLVTGSSGLVGSMDAFNQQALNVLTSNKLLAALGAWCGAKAIGSIDSRCHQMSAKHSSDI